VGGGDWWEADVILRCYMDICRTARECILYRRAEMPLYLRACVHVTELGSKPVTKVRFI